MRRISAALPLFALLMLYGCRAPVTSAAAADRTAEPAALRPPLERLNRLPAAWDADRPAEVNPALSDAEIESQRKRVAGRRASLKEIERVASEIRPLVEVAARQP